MLRTDLFKTVDREDTRFIAVRDTLTPADPTIDAKAIDKLHNRQGRLGIGFHFLILVCGIIVLCRDIDTVGAHSKDLDEISVSIGLVGGTCEDERRKFTRTAEQEEALADLIPVLSEIYPDAAVHDTPVV